MPGIITFAPHSRRAVGKYGNELLTTLPQRLKKFQEGGIAVCWVCDFDARFSRQTARDFVNKILARSLQIKGLCVGEGFRFGQNRRGNISLLKKMGKELGFWVREVPTVKVGAQAVSSSTIRKLVRRGEAGRVFNFLGRDYCLSGRVFRGTGRGKAWGYPTANFYPEQLLPSLGVYAARIQLGKEIYPGILYIGTRPTFSLGEESRIMAEALIFGWRGSLYHRRIKVFLKKRMRGDIKFKDATALLKQIKLDGKRVKRFLEKRSFPADGSSPEKRSGL